MPKCSDAQPPVETASVAGSRPSAKAPPRPRLACERACVRVGEFLSSANLSDKGRALRKTLSSTGHRLREEAARWADLAARRTERFDGTWLEENAGTLALGCAALFLVWAYFAEVDQTVRAAGEITAGGSTQEVSHLEGGIVESIAVHEGDRVAAGDLLVRLSPIASRSRQGEDQEKKNALRAEAARLEAEIEGREPSFPADLSAAAPEAVARQTAAFLESKAEYAHAAEQSAQRVRQHEAGVVEAKARLAALQGRIAPAEELARMQEGLGEHGRRSDVLNARMAVAAIRSEMAPLAGTIAKEEAAAAEARSAGEELKSKHRAEAAHRLAVARAELSGIEHGLASDADRLGRTEIRSPAAGIVKRLRLHTPGSVVAPGAVVADITPTGTGIVVRAWLRPEDRANVIPGLPVSIRVAAFPFALYGVIDGKVLDVSSDTISPDERTGAGAPPANGEKAAAYRVLVKADGEVMPRRYEGEPEPRLGPGMTVECDVVTGRRTLLGRLVSPILKTLALSASGR